MFFQGAFQVSHLFLACLDRFIVWQAPNHPRCQWGEQHLLRCAQSSHRCLGEIGLGEAIHVHFSVAMAKWLHSTTQCYRDIQGSDRISRPAPFKIKTKMDKASYMTYIYVSTFLHNPGIWNPTAKVSWLHEHHSVLHQSCSVMPVLTNFIVFRLLPLQNPFSLTRRFSSSKNQLFRVFGVIFELLTLHRFSNTLGIPGSISTIPDDSDHQVWSHFRAGTFWQCWIDCDDFL